MKGGAVLTLTGWAGLGHHTLHAAAVVEDLKHCACFFVLSSTGIRMLFLSCNIFIIGFSF